MKVLIAGGSGFIGRNFLLECPPDWDCTATYDTSEAFPDFLRQHGLSHVTPLHVRLRDEESVAGAFRGSDTDFDICLFVHGNSDIGLSCREPMADIRANIHPLVNLLGAVRVKRFVFMSSGSVYEGHAGEVHPGVPVNPTIPYSVDKLASEAFVRFFAKSGRVESYVNVRFFGAYGPMEPSRKIYTNLIRALCLENQSVFTLRGNGENFIDAMYIDDAVRALMSFATGDEGNVTVDLCYGAPLSINELVQSAAHALDRAVTIAHEGDTPEYTTFRASTEPVERLFGFRPEIGLEDGMRRFADYLLHVEWRDSGAAKP